MRFFRRTPDAPATPPTRLRRALRVFGLCTVVLLATAGFAFTAFPTAVPVSRTVAWLFGAEYLGRDGVVIQKGDADCGIAALQMVLVKRGIPAASLDSARAAVLARNDDGASMLELKALAEAHGVRAEGWRMGLAGLSRAPLPAVVHLGDHFAVVDRILAGGRVELRDPSLGRLRMSAEDFRDIWTGNTLIFPPAGTPAAASASDAASESESEADVDAGAESGAR
ncbi:MAG TPA: cysteine peptidase family C39 domain-containing protein [Longimicrobium sp.]|nr:cysteine peptidase family C39 domain-containing protein [Longimicrobium sp.]